jgi:hypothetical protein
LAASMTRGRFLTQADLSQASITIFGAALAGPPAPS